MVSPRGGKHLNLANIECSDYNQVAILDRQIHSHKSFRDEYVTNFSRICSGKQTRFGEFIEKNKKTKAMNARLITRRCEL